MIIFDGSNEVVTEGTAMPLCRFSRLRKLFSNCKLHLSRYYNFVALNGLYLKIRKEKLQYFYILFLKV